MHTKLTGNVEMKKPLGRHRCRWKGNIKMDRKNEGVRVWIGFIWLKTRSSGGMLLKR
jgi:hypothetical protein